MRRKRAFSAIAAAIGTLVLMLGIGLQWDEMKAERSAEAGHARELMLELRRSATFAYFPSAYELTAAEDQLVPQTF